MDAPADATVVLNASTFTLASIPASTTNLKLVIAAAPQGNGITRAYSKAVQIGDVRNVVDTAIDIKSDFETIHGSFRQFTLW